MVSGALRNKNFYILSKNFSDSMSWFILNCPVQYSWRIVFILLVNQKQIIDNWDIYWYMYLKYTEALKKRYHQKLAKIHLWGPMRSKSRIKDPFSVQQTNGFMTAEHEKLTDEISGEISDFTLETLFEENTTRTVFRSVSEHPKRTSTVIWKGCWHSPSFVNYVFICVRLAFLRILQSNIMLR